MSRPIQSLAPGFLSLLGLKNNGALPPDLVDALQPVIDQLPFMFLGAREVLPFTANLNVTAVSNFVFPELVVPANEVWWVHGYTAQLGVPAGNSWSGSPIHYSRNTVPIRVGSLLSGGAAAATAYDLPSLRDFLAAGGDQFGLLTSAFTGAGPITATGYISITRLFA